MTARSTMRYPGSKDKIAPAVLRHFPETVTFPLLNGGLTHYCEPFIGCGAMALRVLPNLPRSARLVFGDKDYGVACLWRAIYERPADLCRLLACFVPSVGLFDEFKARDGETGGDFVAVGFRKFALHQMSFSGLGAMAGGPIGGREQRSDYPVGCRYNAARHVRDVTKQSALLRQFAGLDVVHGDFADALALVGADGFAYLDPPYFVKGAQLYRHAMDADAHERLARALRGAPFDWVLSYDDAPEVRELYRWATVHEFEMVATIETKRGKGTRRKNNELVIVPGSV